jgi:D-beta-D-heptose 7-phosphate kinase/D-beta-D-heptose 1-phosphate adenosyltransferase
MTQARQAELLAAMAGVPVLVVGDAMLDEYVWGVAERVSPEAPVLVVRSQRTTHVPGGAANVVGCLLALGARCGLSGAVGCDRQADVLRAKLVELGAAPVELVADALRPTTVKTRVLAHTQQVVRIDHESRAPLENGPARDLLARVASALDGCRGLLLSDYDKGVLNPETIPALLALAAQRGVRVAVNAKPRLAAFYQGVDLLTVNRVEAEALCGITPDTPAKAAHAAEWIGEHLDCGATLVTLGGEGAVLHERHGATTAIAPIPVAVCDPAGAGDTTIATAHLALCAGATPVEAARVAMYAAAVVVRKVGVATATPREILALTGPPVLDSQAG